LRKGVHGCLGKTQSALKKYYGFAPPETVDLNCFETWIQIHKLPIGYRNVPLIKNLTDRKVGKAIKVETDVHGAGNFVRVRAVLDVRKALACFVTISRASQLEFYQVKYEKLPKFCGACGFMGHTHLECGTGELDVDKLKWGDFLKADWDTWHGRNFGGNRGGGSSGNRGRGREVAFAGRGLDAFGRGRNTQPSWRYNALLNFGGPPRDEEELDDTGSSPVKSPNMDIENGSQEALAKRRLNLEAEDGNEMVGEDAIIPDPNAMRVDGDIVPYESLGDDVENDRKKHSKKDGANSTSQGSAASQGDAVHSQRKYYLQTVRVWVIARQFAHFCRYKSKVTPM
jgi:hypothetical protein